MERMDVERLVSVETQLKAVESQLVEHRIESKARNEELRTDLRAMSTRLDAVLARPAQASVDWGAFAAKNWKALVFALVLVLGGPAGAAKLAEYLATAAPVLAAPVGGP